MTLVQFIGGMVAIGVVLSILAIQRRWRRVLWVSRRLLVLYGLLVVVLVVGELYFRYFFIGTDGRLASNNWSERFWSDNTLGYRDREWTPADWEGRIRVAVLGDSIGAGWGIEDPADRFSGVLAARLGDEYAVMNLSLPGSFTLQETVNLETHPASPVDVVVLQYFLDDILYALLQLGLPTPTMNQMPQIMLESYLANYLFSGTYGGLRDDYWSMYYAAYDNQVVWELHQNELDRLIDYVERIDAELIIVIFPNMLDPVGSIAYVDRVAHYFEARGYGDHVIKLFDAVASWEDRYGVSPILSQREAHPTVAFHRYVAELLYTRYFAAEQP